MPPFRPTAERWTAAVAEIKRLKAEVARLMTLLRSLRERCSCGACDGIDEESSE